MHERGAPYPGDLLEHLRAFVSLAARLDTPGPGAFERAAGALRLDPSVLRRRMQALSAWLGQPLPDVILGLERAHPGLRVAVRRVGSAPCLRLLEEGELDVGVVRAAKAPRGFAATRLCADRLWVAAPTGHPLLRAARLDAPRLAAEPLIVYGEASQTRGRVASASRSSRCSRVTRRRRGASACAR